MPTVPTIFAMEVVLEKVRDRLRDGLTNVHQPGASLRIMKDGQRIPPTAGEEFISVHPGDVGQLSIPAHQVKHHGYSFRVSITRRLNAQSNETAGERILTYDETKLERLKPSMYERADQIVTLLEDGNGWTLLNQINAVIGPTGTFLVPFGLVSVNPVPEEVGPDYFDTIYDKETQVSYVGLVLPLEFGEAEFLRPM